GSRQNRRGITTDELSGMGLTVGIGDPPEYRTFGAAERITARASLQQVPAIAESFEAALTVLAVGIEAQRGLAGELGKGNDVPGLAGRDVRGEQVEVTGLVSASFGAVVQSDVVGVAVDAIGGAHLDAGEFGG